MADDPKQPAAPVPPKLNLRQTGTIPAVDPANPPSLDLRQTLGQIKKATTRIDMAAAAMIPEEKSKTTRINLGSLGADLSATPKTIKIQRPTEAATIKLNRPTPAASPNQTVPIVPASVLPSAMQQKRQTSRIPLQDALAAPADSPAAGAKPDAAPAAGAPKTIRIKRPTDAAAGAEAAPETGPVTQRKTIKLKRPGSGDLESGRPSVTLPKAAAAFAAAQAAGEIQEDEPGPAFGLLSIAATLVALVLVYLICVQAFPSLGLSWPGQVPTLH